MKKLQHIIMVALILIGLVTPALAQEQTDDFNVAAKHAIAIESTTGKVLYEKDATT
ncbi:MAG: D-alanyl-D-alanine carboxypeptidase, partial [Streptococcus sp.]|nr:D-alanyl-D-alanine carboxypeptidase [Streptococcus sp.]